MNKNVNEIIKDLKEKGYAGTLVCPQSYNKKGFMYAIISYRDNEPIIWATYKTMSGAKKSKLWNSDEKEKLIIIEIPYTSEYKKEYEHYYMWNE